MQFVLCFWECRGDPKIYYTYWKKMDDKCKVTIKASELMSYFGDYDEGGVFYQLPEFSNAVHRMHRIVGNAVTEGRYIIGGTGSSQLFTVALRALASTVNATTNNSVLKKKHIPVVCAQPYYSVNLFVFLLLYFCMIQVTWIFIN